MSPQPGQRERGDTTDSPRGRRQTTTFRKLPTHAPSANAKQSRSGVETALSPIAGTLARLAEVALLEQEHARADQPERVERRVQRGHPGARQLDRPARARVRLEVEPVQVRQGPVERLEQRPEAGHVAVL